MAALTAAGILTAGLLQLGSASIASASMPPAGPTAKAVSEGVALSPASEQNFGFYWNGVLAEYVAKVSINGNTLTVTRYPGASSVIDRWMAGSAPAYTLGIGLFDYIGNVFKSYTFYTPVLARVEISRNGQQKLTIKYLP
ncbi:hypothetical protein [Streptomyces viridosporus]|uniref:hypothetical protein n=1 Tax=Streptomyces viridosporus TaxID=67581 RepID=UPI00117E8415|nr:hypothetical protein [Streptomyces viridosporus]